MSDNPKHDELKDSQEERSQRGVTRSMRGSKVSGFGLGFWIAILSLAAVVGFAQWRVSSWFTEEVGQLSEEAHQALEEQSKARARRGGEATPVDSSGPKPAPEEEHSVPLPPEVRVKRSLLALSFKEGEERFAESHKAMRSEIRAEFTAIRAQSHALVSAWADWYYSVTGEYTRLIKLLMAAAGETSLEAAKRAASRYMAEQVRAQLIDPINADQRVSELEDRLSAQLKRVNQSVIQRLQEQLSAVEEEAELRGRVHPDDIELLKDRERDLKTLDELNIISPIALATKALSVGATKLLISGGVKAGVKVAAQTGVKAGVKAGSSAGVKAGLKVGQAVAVKVASKGVVKSALALWSKLMIKFGVKAAAKGGGAAAAAATGTVACSFLGPGAFACGLVAGTVTWFAVDKVIVEVDEHLNREEFEAELKRDLDSSWAEVEIQLHQALDAHYLKLQGVLRAPTPEGFSAPPKTTTLIEALQGEPESGEGQATQETTPLPIERADDRADD